MHCLTFCDVVLSKILNFKHLHREEKQEEEEEDIKPI
jgi:hypothetical protein